MHKVDVRMKKVAFLAPSYPVLSETFIRTEVESVRANGHDVCVMTFIKYPDCGTFNYDIHVIGEKIYFSLLYTLSPIGIFKALHFIAKQRSMPKLSLFQYSLKLALQMRKAGVNHVHAHFAQHTCTHAITAAKMMGISSSFVAHGHDLYEAPFDVDLKVNNSNFVVAVCKDMENDLRKINNDKIKLLHCGVKTNEFKPPTLSLNKPQDGTPIKLVFLGRLVEQKGLHYLLQSLAELNTSQLITLDIIGDGELRTNLQQQAYQLGLSKFVHFHGAKSSHWVSQNLARFDCLVAPFCVSHSGCVDTGPLVLKEAMAVGVPVITTDLMGCKEIVAPGTGLIVKQKNSPSLSLAITKFINYSPEKREDMRRLARLNIEDNFDALNQAKSLSNWIEACAS
ncbi:glycosyltransferase family 4 protein [Moritella sp. F3]|uniref:glycosyltransferase family 4 protein n=1 Tax=Moritella sp. F3 TaxID=2718882 RepID=UPI0018E113CD|nr:glycosyltransferase family 4 protein [Moritella sp. F3]GIC75872.1 colanic acid biosynthesis glycosyltransferase WcaL [Moritella sp. F1]GIC83877.1 colanic acid biosynthesis glycosyltransferase WcaL [Moritella sp. F3]